MAEQMVFDADQVTAEVAEGIEKIQNASNLEELKAIKTTYAGADSAMTKASKAIGSLPADQKKEAGKLMGKLRADFGLRLWSQGGRAQGSLPRRPRLPRRNRGYDAAGEP